MKIKKAVFPVAGFGTRFLPATKANPKEMLPIVDKPLIQYAVEEAISAGITQLIFVTSYSKRAIEDHFDSNYELETRLAESGKHKLLARVKNILPEGVSCVYVRQPKQLGWGHAVLCAKHAVGDEPFVVLLADDLIYADQVCLQQMLNIYNQTGNSILAVQKIASSETDKYGIVELDKEGLEPSYITNIVEKPKVEEAPSDLAVVGRYILTPRIFYYLAAIEKGVIGEIQLTDAISGLLNEQKVNICRFTGERYDCGDKLGYLQATIEYALNHPKIGIQFKEYLRERLR